MTQLAQHTELEISPREERRQVARALRRAAKPEPHFTERPVSFNALLLALTAFFILTILAGVVISHDRTGDNFTPTELR